jgi:hypothetical protein
VCLSARRRHAYVCNIVVSSAVVCLYGLGDRSLVLVVPKHYLSTGLCIRRWFRVRPASFTARASLWSQSDHRQIGVSTAMAAVVQHLEANGCLFFFLSATGYIPGTSSIHTCEPHLAIIIVKSVHTISQLHSSSDSSGGLSYALNRPPVAVQVIRICDGGHVVETPRMSRQLSQHHGHIIGPCK